MLAAMISPPGKLRSGEIRVLEDALQHRGLPRPQEDSNMAQVGLKTLDGKQQIIPEDALDKLRSGLHGKLLLPGEPGYDDARTIWNAMIDRKPAIIVSAADAADVTRAVQFAREHKLLVAIRGGGHNIAGNAVCEGGLMIDLTPMKTI